MKRAAYFGSVSLLLGLSCVTLTAIALATTRWHYSFRNGIEYGLFESCFYGPIRQGCQRLTSVLADAAYLRATQSFVIMGAIVAVFACFVAVFVACGKGPTKLNIGVAVLFLITGIFLLVGSSVYTGILRPDSTINLLRFGYSLWISWAATVNAFLVVPFAFLAKSSKDY